MNRVMLLAFSDELEKISAGPALVYDPQAEQSGSAAAYWPPKKVDQVDTIHPQLGLKKYVGKKHGLIVTTHPSQYAYHPEGKAAYRALRRHEMTHWARDKKGKMKGIGEGGLGNVLRTAREEVVAYGSQDKALRRGGAGLGTRVKAVLRTPKLFLGSMRTAYPKGVLRAALRRV
jgi:hypothetical protein